MKKVFFLFTCIFILNGLIHAQPMLSKARQAELYMKNGDFVTAIALYDELLAADPNNALYLLNRGWSKLNASSFTRGAEDLLAALKIDNTCSRCYIGLAIVSMQNGYYDDAIEQATLAIKTEDTASFNYFIRAQVFEAKGEDFKAGLDFNRAIQLNPMVADYYYSRGHFLFRMAKYEDAIDDFSSAVLLEPGIADYHFQRGYTYYMIQNFTFALIDVRKAIELDPTNADYWLGKGAIEEAAGDLDGAIESYTVCAELNPTNALAFFNRANIYFEKAMLDSSCMDYDRCLKALALSQYPREDMQIEATEMIANHCDTTSPAYYYQRGLMALEMKKYAEALEILNKGLASWPIHPLLNAFKGNALMGLKRYDEAVSAYLDALKKTDETPVDVRESYTLRSNDVDPDIYMRQLYSSVYDGLSKSYLAIGKFEEALESVNKAIFLSEKIPDAPVLPLQLMKANILSTMGEDQQAMVLLDELIKLNPEFASAYVIRARLLLKKAILTGNKKARFYYATAPQSGMYYLDLPKKFKSEKNDNVLINSAMGDCKVAIALNPDFAEAYFVMGEIKLLSGMSDYCNDFLMAEKLGITDALDLLGKPCKQ